MSEARELLEGLAARLRSLSDLHTGKGNRSVAAALGDTSNVISEALAAKTEPEAVPDLPEWLMTSKDTSYFDIHLSDGILSLPSKTKPDDLDRIAEACRILAARRRAGL